MPLLLIVLLAILVAQIGFWNTLGAVLGAIGVIVLFVLIVLVTLVVVAALAFRRMGRR